MNMIMINTKISNNRSIQNKKMIINTNLNMTNIMIKKGSKTNKFIKHRAKRSIN